MTVLEFMVFDLIANSIIDLLLFIILTYLTVIHFSVSDSGYLLSLYPPLFTQADNCFSIYQISELSHFLLYFNFIFCKPIYILQDIPSLTSKSEQVKNTIHWFG